MRVSSNAPSMSRRSMMNGLAFALAGASLPVTAIAGVTARKLLADEAPAQQDPEIYRLWLELDRTHKLVCATYERENAIIAEWDPRWPEPPAELWGGSEIARDLTGWAQKDGDGKTIRVHTAEWARSMVKHYKPRTQPPKQTRKKSERAEAYEYWSQLLPIAERYEQEKARILEMSAYQAAHDEYWGAVKELKAVIATIMASSGDTHKHDVLRARALIRFGSLEPVHRMLPVTSDDWGAMIARAFIKYARAAGEGTI